MLGFNVAMFFVYLGGGDVYYGFVFLVTFVCLLISLLFRLLAKNFMSD